jgi:hypothetical protein
MYSQTDEILDFGDVWVFDEIVRQTGFDKVLNNIIPESNSIERSKWHKIVVF